MIIAGIYLAAGSGSRLGGGKPSVELLPGVPMGGVALKVLLGSGLDKVVVVVRAGDELKWLPAAAYEAEDGEEASRTAFSVMVCEDAAMGMAHSLRCGLRKVMSCRPEAVLVMLADQPFVSEELVGRLLSAWRLNPQLDYAAAARGDVLLPPVLLAKTMFPAIQRLSGDQGARRLLASGDFIGLALQVSDDREVTDVDDFLDLEGAKQAAREGYVK